MRTIRVTVVGDGDIGKTCMLQVYKDKKFNDVYTPTIFDSYSMTIDIADETYTIILQDTAGQEDFDKLRQLSYVDTDVFIICYAINNRDSFENVRERWIPELKEHCPKSKLILVGTKSDLDSHREVTVSEGKSLYKEVDAHAFIENSAKYNRKIDDTIKFALLAVAPPFVRIKKKSCPIL